MGIFDSIVRPQAAITKETITTSKELYESMFGGVESSTGIAISPESAVRYTTVLACVRVLSESVASLPCILYKRRSDGGKDRATEHPLYAVLHDRSNAWNTAYEYFEGQMTNLAMRGNGYALPEWNSRKQCIGLVPLNPDPVTVDQARDWTPIYKVTLPDNSRTTLTAKQIHHVRGPLPVRYVGRSIISLARDAIGLGLAAEKFGSHLYKNGVKPSGVLKHPKTLGPEATETLRQQFQDKYGGLSNSSKPLILEEAMEWVALSINPDDAQFLETRKFQRSEIAGIFRVPAHMIGDLERSTNNNIEHQSLEFVMHTLRPWLKRIEQAINRDLLSDAERGEYFAEFLIDDLLRGDIKTRYAAYAVAIQNKIMNANEVRAIENRNPREGGDVYENPAIQVDKPDLDEDVPAKKAA